MVLKYHQLKKLEVLPYLNVSLANKRNFGGDKQHLKINTARVDPRFKSPEPVRMNTKPSNKNTNHALYGNRTLYHLKTRVRCQKQYASSAITISENATIRNK